MSTVSEIFGATVRAHRITCAWSQQDLANRMQTLGHTTGWIQSCVTKVEQGKRPVSIDEAASLAHLFGVTVDEMLTGSDSNRAVEIAIAEAELQGQRERVAAAIAGRDQAAERLADLQRTPKCLHKDGAR